MLKKAIQAILQRILGFERYLFYFSRWKIATLRWDSHEKEGDFNHFLTLLSPSDQVLDIGANVGIMTVLMAKACPQGQVFAFEPIPENFRTLRKIIKHFKLDNVSLYQAALGETAGEVSMTMPILKGVRMQGLSHINHPSIEGYQSNMMSFTVPQMTLDSFDELKNGQVDAIKMDVENYEQFVIKGGIKLLETCKPILYCELWDNENRSNCFRMLQGIGYQIFVLEKDQLKPFDKEKHLSHNFFFLPEKVGNHPN